ncbi:uncharacterized protein LOC127798854 [Diospyros lotus]|uniref:uncharacterized protein LOC127798854 n=1 Tax=Diospyros lotus TaxID=55363 RepID=UPI0022515A8E|nr:uncharacterized protein LOC127798854 [Diospyros lotus]
MMDHRILFLIALFTLAASSSAGEDSLTAYQVLQAYDFPVGLLPTGVKGYELDRSTGKFKAYLDKTCTFEVSGYQLRYRSTITGVISKGKITSLKGISVKVLLFWVNIVSVTREGDELEFSVGIASAVFEVESFAECPQCGCGFDCVNGGRGRVGLTFKRLASSLF